jgi:hypothetical protein
MGKNEKTKVFIGCSICRHFSDHDRYVVIDHEGDHDMCFGNACLCPDYMEDCWFGRVGSDPTENNKHNDCAGFEQSK